MMMIQLNTIKLLIHHNHITSHLRFRKYIWILKSDSMNRDHHRVTTWLMIGVIMVFVQILLGGITRLTGSGLSITRWDIVTGVLPPLNDVAWNYSFELYKATPQYQKINTGISLSYFKYIFFWEYFHRLWARSMGFVFLIPFCFFLIRKSLSKAILLRLALVIVIAMLAALFGWIMVASGLIERPWVNAYNLTVHLVLGISLLLALFNAWMKEKGFSFIVIEGKQKAWINWLFGLASIQVILGGMVSGMKSALNYPTWPKMQSDWIPAIVFDKSHWSWNDFLLYDQSGFMPAMIQFLHRNLAYGILLMIVIFSYQWITKNSSANHWLAYCLLGIIVVQALLGIMILLNSIGSIPVFYGSAHQAVGILALTFLFYLKQKITQKEHN
jgi:cytochrome c oxidase assembly protein subunit 15